MNSSNKNDSGFRIHHVEIPSGRELEARKPHRHKFQEIIFVEKGNAVHYIDGESYDMNGPVIILVAKGKMHSFIPQPSSQFYAIRFADEFLPEKYQGLFCQFMQFSKLPIIPDIVRNTIIELFTMMFTHYNSIEFNPSFARHLLAALLEIINTEREKLMVSSKHNANGNYELFNKFLFFLETNYIREKSVQYYAGNLNISLKKLGEICKQIFGDSPSRIIEKRAMLEAKRLLIYSNQTIQEIAYELGFNDHSYFTKAFRKNEDLTPTEFRQKHRTE